MVLLPETPAPLLRWFIALVPPQAIQDRAQAVIEELTLRYQTRTAKAPPHITLVPPSELEGNAIPAEACKAIAPVRAALADFAQSQTPLTVTMDGFSAFLPRVLFIDVVKTLTLLALKAELEEQLVQCCGLPRDRHPSFSPHLTVVSRKLDRAKFAQIWAELESREFAAAWDSDALTLLRYEHQHWQIDQTFELTNRFSEGNLVR